MTTGLEAPTQAPVALRETQARFPARIGALGVLLVLTVALAWVTALPYLIVRAGLPSPIRLTVVDGIHVYVGVAMAALVVAKIRRVGVRARVPGVSDVVLWQRWLSASLGVLYAAVALTGVAALLPADAGTRRVLVNAHLLASVWAAVPTTWHVWHYRHRALPFISRPLRRPGGRQLWVIALVSLTPVAAIAAAPRAVAPLTASGAGAAWQLNALPGVFLDRLAETPSGAAMVAGGDGLYAAVPGGPWRRVELPAATPQTVLGLTLPTGPVAAYVGTQSGLFSAPSVTGPYTPLPLPAREVHAIATSPGPPGTVWVTSTAGFLRSSDYGRSWTAANAGISSPSTAWAVTGDGGVLFGADGEAIYTWDGTRWRRSLAMPAVMTLDVGPSGELWASSMGPGVQVFDGRTWREADAGLAHGHGGVRGTHVVSVTPVSADLTLAATMLEGVGVSHDQGRSWDHLSTGLPVAGTWRILEIAPRHLLAATEHGIYTYELPDTPGAGPGWWLLVATLAVGSGLGLVAAALVATGWRRRPAVAQESRTGPTIDC